MTMKRRRKLYMTFTGTLAVFFLAISVFGTFEVVSAGFFNSGLGTRSIIPKVIRSPITSGGLSDPSFGYRKYTYEEMFSSDASSYSIPFGDSEGHFLFKAENHTVIDMTRASEVDKAIFLSRGETPVNPFMEFSVGMTNSSKSMSQWVSSLISGLTTSFFDSDFICSDPDSTDGDCINLLYLAGGSQSSGDTGIIGALSKGFFMPLIVLAFLSTAVFVGYKGLIKQEFRASLGAISWSLFVFMLGIFVLNNPWLVARAPHNMNTIINGCLLSAMNGESCVSSGGMSTEQFAFVSPVCQSDSSSAVTFNDKMKLQLNGLTCMIGKGFSLDRWSEQQFGYSFDDLYTIDPPDGHTVYPESKLVGSKEDYCVYMYHTSSPNELKANSSVTMSPNGSYRVCNIALAYMANRTIGDFGTNANMADIIVTASKDDTMWAAFNGSGRDITGTFSLLGTVASAVAFVPTILYAHAYSLTATLLMIFSPIFLLFGIHPGKGKKLFLGWLETIVSSCLKFMVTGLLVLVMIVLFSSIVSTVNGPMVFLSSLVLSFAFISYRKELVNLIGSANMGGSKVSNKAGELMKKMGDSAKRGGSAVAGGALGGAAVSMADPDFKEKSLEEKVAAVAAGAAAGSGKSLGMELRRGRGVIANAVRSGGQVARENRSKRDEYQKGVTDEAHRQESMQVVRENADRISGAMDDYIQEARQIRDDGNTYHAEQVMAEYDKQRADEVIAAQSQVNNNANSILDSGMSEQIRTVNHKITKTTSSEVIKESVELSDKMATEAKGIEGYIKPGSIDADSQKSDYLNHFKATEDQRAFEAYEKLKSALDRLDIDGPTKEKRLDDFINSQSQSIERAVEKIDNNIAIIKLGDKSILDSVDLKQHVAIKDVYENERVEIIKEYSKRPEMKLPNLDEIEY